MSYVGLCNDATSTQDLQPQEDLIFHAYSIKEMLDVINGSANASASCAIDPTGAKTNTPPSLTLAGTDYTIPSRTPFVLDVTATDADPEDAGKLTYSWEQMNVGAANPTNEDEGTRPLFRSYMPVTSSKRFFPASPSAIPRTICDVITPEFPRAPIRAPKLAAAATRSADGSATGSASASALRTVASMFEPVSPSGTG